MNVEHMFDSFKGGDCFYVNESLQTQWRNQVLQYEKAIEPVEKEICSKLRAEVFADQTLSATQRMREF